MFTLKNLMIATPCSFSRSASASSALPAPPPGCRGSNSGSASSTAPTAAENVPFALASLFAVVIIGFGALLLASARAVASTVGSTISGALFLTYSLGAALLAIQQTQIWMTLSGALAVAVATVLALAYGAAWLVRRDGTPAAARKTRRAGPWRGSTPEAVTGRCGRPLGRASSRPTVRS